MHEYVQIYTTSLKFILLFFFNFYLQLKCIMENLTGSQLMLTSYSHTYVDTSVGQLTPQITAQTYLRTIFTYSYLATYHQSLHHLFLLPLYAYVLL